MERLEKILAFSYLFSPMRMEGNVFKKFQMAVYRIAKQSLLEGLDKKHKKVLLFKHWHQPDPNDYDTGQNLALIDVLISDACFWSMPVKGSQIETKFSMGVIEYFTGEKDKVELSRILEEINEIWEKKHIAKISFNKEEHAIEFEILTLEKKK